MNNGKKRTVGFLFHKIIQKLDRQKNCLRICTKMNLIVETVQYNLFRKYKLIRKHSLGAIVVTL